MITSHSEDTLRTHFLPWQVDQQAVISAQIENKSLPHALLFSGAKGIGKNIFAKYLSSILVCESTNKNIEGVREPCGHCKQCKLYDGGTHPDFKNIEPEEGSSSIKVDQIRKLVEFFSQSSQQGGRKIAVIHPAEALNHNAANALLKTLEEPSGNSVIVLVSHQSGMLLPTIRSRCQVVEFKLPSEHQSLEWMKANLDPSSELKEEIELKELLALANNSPLKALSYADISALTEYRLMLDELGALLKNDSLSTTLATRWNDDMAALRLSWMMLWLEQIIQIKYGAKLKVSEKAEKMFTYLADKTSSLELFTLHSKCLEQYRLFLGTSNPNKVMSFEVLLHSWLSLMRKV